MLTTTTNSTNVRARAGKLEAPPKCPLYFDPWLTAGGATLRTFVEEIAATIEANEERSRARKKTDRFTFLRCVDALVCNLAQSALSVGGAAFGLPLRAGADLWKAGRYNSHAVKRATLRNIVEAADECGYLTLTKSTWRGVSSQVQPSAVFGKALERRGVHATDIGRKDGAEVIRLSRKDEDDGRVLVEYRDNSETRRMREELDALNRHLHEAEIAFDEDGKLPRICAAQRTLSRRFLEMPRAPRFALGGWLYGGFWINLARDRRQSLRILGERPVEVDYSACFLRLACADGGHPIGHDIADPYALLPHVKRDALKIAINALLFCPDLKRWPEAAIATGLPARWKPSAARAEVVAVFPGLASHFMVSRDAGPPIGYRLFRLESDAMMHALGALRTAGVVALPLHDALLVTRQSADLAKDALEKAALRAAGVALPARVKSVEANSLEETGPPPPLTLSVT